MDRAVVIANPAASQFTGGVHRAAQRMLRRRFDVNFVWPNGPEHARSIAEQAVADGVPLVVAIGGDGIVHHVGQALVGSQTTLGIVPVGTTNVVARMFKIPERPTAALRLLISNHLVIPSPVLRVAAVTEEGEVIRHALFSMGAGFDAEVVARAEAEPYRKYRFGGMHYARTALGVVWKDLRHRRDVLVVSHDETEFTGIGAMAQIHPIYTYFGKRSLTIDPETPDPLSVLIIESLPLRRAPAVLWGAARNGLAGVAGMTLIRHPEVTIRTVDRPLPAQLDGELIHGVSLAHLSVLPEAIRLAVPHPSRR